MPIAYDSSTLVGIIMFSILNKLNKIQRFLPNDINKYLILKTFSTTLFYKINNNITHMLCTDIVWMDLEMTGLDFKNDKILEVSCLITDKDLAIKEEGPCLIIKQPPEVLNNMNEWCKKHHRKSGLTEKCLQSNITLAEAEQILLHFLKQHVPQKECPLAGNSVYMDRLFLHVYMPLVNDYLHYRIIDVSTIKELARRWNPQIFQAAPVKKFAHRSLDDIKESIEEMKYYRSFFNIEAV